MLYKIRNSQIKIHDLKFHFVASIHLFWLLEDRLFSLMTYLIESYI